jgi:hypothetical protein
MAEVASYPTWQINGKSYSGMQSYETLAQLSSFRAATPPARPERGSAVGKPDGVDLGIDFSGAAPVVRTGEDCDLATGGAEDCK